MSSCTPFTAPDSYRFVGMVQLIAAVLLITQRFATPESCSDPCFDSSIIFAGVLCDPHRVGGDTQAWGRFCSFGTSTSVHVFRHGPAQLSGRSQVHPTMQMYLWNGCGIRIHKVLYVGNAVTGEVYRPQGAEWEIRLLSSCSSSPSCHSSPINSMFGASEKGGMPWKAQLRWR